MEKISAYVIAYNEAEKISATLAGLAWADEIIVVDSWSTDGTPEIATRMGAKVVQVAFTGFGNLRNCAIQACSHEWIFSLDSDERCTPEVAAEIKQIVADPHSLDVYRTPRRNFFMGQWIKRSGWYPNYRQPQLFRYDAMSYDAKPVHEGYVLHTKKPIGHMKNSIWQFPFKDMSEVMRKAERYSTLGAKKLLHKKLSMRMALSHAVWAFIKHYVFKCGALDGWPGFVIALSSFESTFYRYVKAIELQQTEKWQPPKET